MKLYLSSYKIGSKESTLKQWISKHGNKIVLIANSRDHFEDKERVKTGIQKDIEMLTNLGFDVVNISLRDYFGDYEGLKKALENYNAFFVIGGNSFVLRKAMQLSGFDKYLKENINNDNFLYAGYSAGICVLAPKLNGLEIVDEPINPYNADEIIYDGIGLLKYVPVPHYKSDHPESALVDEVVSYMEKNNIKYKTLSDGDVIIEDLSKEVEI